MFKVPEEVRETFKKLGANRYSHGSYETRINFGWQRLPFTDIIYFWKDGAEIGYWTKLSPTPTIFQEARVWGAVAIKDQTFYDWD